MNRNDDTPLAPALVADAGPMGARVSRAEAEQSNGQATQTDGLVDHDPTLKWIISEGDYAGKNTPPPLPAAANTPTPPPLHAKQRRALTPEPAAHIRTPPPLAPGPAEEKTPPPNIVAAPPAPVAEAKPSALPVLPIQPARPATRHPGAAPLVTVSLGATPADFFAADSTPPPPSKTTASQAVGAAPVAVLRESAGSDAELSGDAIELIPATAGQLPPPAFRAESTEQDTPRDGIRLGGSPLSPATEILTEPREVEPDAVEMLEAPQAAPEVPAEPREVEPDAVEMLESAEHLTVPGVEPEKPTVHAPAPPPVPSEPPAPPSPPPRPSAIAAALFDEYQTPVSGGDPIPEALARRTLQKRAKPWYEEVFDEDFLRTLPFMTPAQTAREVDFIREALSPPKGGEVLDVGCGYGRHALELAQQGLRLTGLDLSLPMLIRAADHAQRRGLAVNFVHADMREMTYNGQFDAAYCMLSSFGYFDEETNLRVATAICRALKPGGRFLLDIINRDYIIGDLPSRVWWEGDGCVVLEEVDFNYHTSRVLIRRSVVFGTGRQSEQEISLRAYSLHEVGKLLRQAGLRVLDVSGGIATKSKFYGAASRNILAVCERPAP
jgi:SAM-dependent methyltransferase